MKFRLLYRATLPALVVCVISAAPPARADVISGFSISAPNVTVAPGATTGNTSTVTVTPSGGFTGSVALTAAVTASPAGAVQPPTLSFGSTTPVSINSANPGTATLTISTTAPVLGRCSAAASRNAPWYAAGGSVLACILFFGIPGRRKGWRKAAGMVILLIAFASSLIACAGINSTKFCSNIASSGTTAGNYAIMITGASGTTTSTGTLTLTVQ